MSARRLPNDQPPRARKLVRYVLALGTALLSLTTFQAGSVAAQSPLPRLVISACSPIPFITQGSSTTVSGVSITATTNSAGPGDTSNTFLYQSNSRIKTVLTFTPSVPFVTVTTRNHADASGFETLTFTAQDNAAIQLFSVEIEDLDTTDSLSPTTVGATISTLTIDYTYDTPVADGSRGSYLELFLACPSLAPATQAVAGTIGTPLTSQNLIATEFSGTVAFSLQSGSLPAGLTLNASTGAITGIPTQGSSATVTISATGSIFGAATASVTFDIPQPPQPILPPPPPPTSTTISESSTTAPPTTPSSVEPPASSQPVETTPPQSLPSLPTTLPSTGASDLVGPALIMLLLGFLVMLRTRSGDIPQ